jgi:hypothetical protein
MELILNGFEVGKSIGIEGVGPENLDFFGPK